MIYISVYPLKRFFYEMAFQAYTLALGLDPAQLSALVPALAHFSIFRDRTTTNQECEASNKDYDAAYQDCTAAN